MRHRPKIAGQPGLKMAPVSAPGWDASKAPDSFRAFADFVHEQAKEVLMRDGNHAEMFLFMPLNGRGHVVIWQGGDRDLEAKWLRRHVRERYAFGFVHVVEAWMRMAPTPDDHILKQLIAGEMRVSQLNPEHRQEALMVSAQSRDGWANSWVDEMVRDAAGKLSLGSCREFSDFVGRFGKVFG